MFIKFIFQALLNLNFLNPLLLKFELKILRDCIVFELNLYIAEAHSHPLLNIPFKHECVTFSVKRYIIKGEGNT